MNFLFITGNYHNDYEVNKHCMQNIAKHAKNPPPQNPMRLVVYRVNRLIRVGILRIIHEASINYVSIFPDPAPAFKN